MAGAQLFASLCGGRTGDHSSLMKYAGFPDEWNAAGMRRGPLNTTAYPRNSHEIVTIKYTSYPTRGSLEICHKVELLFVCPESQDDKRHVVNAAEPCSLTIYSLPWRSPFFSDGGFSDGGGDTSFLLYGSHCSKSLVPHLAKSS